MFFYYLLAAVLVAVDQLTKMLTVQSLALFESKEVIPNILSFYYIQNRGAAWGIFEGSMFLFYIITIGVVGYLIYTAHKYKITHRLTGWSFSFILAGAVGNFIDRLRMGYVVDMLRLDFIDFPIFNVADVCLTIGVILMMIYILFFEDKKETD